MELTPAQKAIIGFLLILAILGIAFYEQIQILLGVKPPVPPPPIRPEEFTGKLELSVKTRSVFEPETTLAITPRWYRELPTGVYEYLETGNVTLTLEAPDKGILYLHVSSSANYIDDLATLEANKFYLDPDEPLLYIDINEDGYLDHVYKFFFNVENVKKEAGVTPLVTVRIYGIPYDTAIAWNTPSDLSGIGTAPTTVYVHWRLVWGGENRGIKILRLGVETNATDETEIKLAELRSIIGRFYWRKQIEELENKRWDINLALKEEYEPYAILVKYEEGMDPQFAYFSAVFEMNFETSTAFSVKIVADIIKPDGTIATISDEVILSV